MNSEHSPLKTLPVLALKNNVLFPNLFVPLSAGRSVSVAAVEAALLTEEKSLVLVAQRDAAVEREGGKGTQLESREIEPPGRVEEE